ncbi:D-glycero-beta-D-manno-heptose 1-phosphate adenylyltransferase [Egicoccus halophilus]|uniref:D-glycero-beta-D-manno-heptose 1-phosphate adenylyltransferase n=1 Tax=Egicoccus halophilus TaxID=1670830 RepID=A0A8J3ABY4_9ACTN|nr:D-glycero-beta-D-manno-heptose 1-phosphate adenylyltransferase [Egicoccus halophilus]GGI04565.1 bifunctional protein HldE [Egicoccus halophilus]
MSRLTVIGDVLLDRDVEGEASRFTPDAPAPVLDEREVHARPGGAGLAAVLAAADGHEVTLVTALADDAGGAELRELLERAGVQVVDLGLAGPTSEKIRLRAGGTSLARWDRGRRTDAADVGAWTSAATAALDTADGVLMACYGRGVSASPGVRAALTAVRAPVVWDPHPRGAAPTSNTTVATPNDAEVRALVPEPAGDRLDAVTARAEGLLAAWGIGGLAVTRGADGALFTRGAGMPLVVPAPTVGTGDPCGAGDRFASRLAGELAAGQLAPHAVAAAVAAASRFVAAGGAGAVRIGEPPTPTDEPHGDARALVEQVRAVGGTVVATGGCFDLVHVGHVQVLEAARALGDCLVVCLNSDDSVRRLKGPNRPIVPQDDRAELLRALGCVDEVVVFDEDTPVEALRRLRPDVFAKGGDYGGSRIPEADVLAQWGGQVVTLPYLEGRSTTRILQEVTRRDS